MEQHPIPQNISSYQFRLVGDMTLKQFFQLAGGIVAGLIVYSTPLLPIIKFPIAIFCGILGALVAFVPFEERPLERWIFAFFKTIYAPTEFFWKRTVSPPKLFQDEPSNVPDAQLQNNVASEYSKTVTKKGDFLGNLEAKERGFLAGLTNVFSGAAPHPTSQIVAPSPTIQGAINVPQGMPTKITPATLSHLVVEEKPKAPEIPQNLISTQEVAPLVAGEEMISTRQAIFSIDAAPPNPPTIPNVIVGQVVDEQRKIIEGAIIEIRDSAGRPVRALRSNKVGHFITVTPLDPGRYDIITEKEGGQFSPVSFEANGNLIPPILVSGKKLEPGISNIESSVNVQSMQTVNQGLNPNFQ